MTYESVKKPSSMFVQMQKKASMFVPPGGVKGESPEGGVQRRDVRDLSTMRTPDPDWLRKSPLFTGHHLLPPKAESVSESPGERVEAAEETVQRELESEPIQEERTTDPNWLVKSPLFTGHHLLQQRAVPEAESVAGGSEGKEIPIPDSIQAKLTIGEPNDKYEQEADRVARQVVDKIHSPTPETLQRQEMGDEDEVRLKSDAGSRGKVEAGVGVTGVRNSPIEGVRVNRKVNSEGETQEASAQLEASIQGKRGSGQPLDESVKEPMEREFGADFSGVRVHTDGKSDELNQAIQAKAFTTGEDIFFRQGAYEPGSRGGRELLAHELTHVVQQRGVEARVAKCSDELDKQKEGEKETRKRKRENVKPERRSKRLKTGGEKELEGESAEKQIKFVECPSKLYHSSENGMEGKLVFEIRQESPGIFFYDMPIEHKGKVIYEFTPNNGVQLVDLRDQHTRMMIREETGKEGEDFGEFVKGKLKEKTDWLSTASTTQDRQLVSWFIKKGWSGWIGKMAGGQNEIMLVNPTDAGESGTQNTTVTSGRRKKKNLGKKP